jgi:hypothetical protein
MKRDHYRQGDILILPVTGIPDNTVPVQREQGKAVLAHGEVTGHHHAIADDTAELVTAEQAAELYLIVHGTDPVSLTHQEHATITIDPGSYQVVRQREYTPERIRQVQD